MSIKARQAVILHPAVHHAAAGISLYQTQTLSYQGVQAIVGSWQSYAGLDYFHLLRSACKKTAA